MSGGNEKGDDEMKGSPINPEPRFTYPETAGSLLADQLREGGSRPGRSDIAPEDDR